MAIHEECGVFGVMSTKRENVAGIAYYGLYALQHRGQESCGIVVNDDGVFSSYKDLGLVSEVFSKDTLAHLSAGNMAVGHVRYGTTGGTTRNNCQPIEVNHQKGKMALAHNGNLSNAIELRDKLELCVFLDIDVSYQNDCCKRSIWFQTVMLWSNVGWSLCDCIRKLCINCRRCRVCERCTSR